MHTLNHALELASALGAELEPRLEGLEETESARLSLQELAKRELTAWCVPQAFGGADTQGLCAPNAVSVRALCALRGVLAQAHSMLDLMLVEQGLGSYPIALGGQEPLIREVMPKVARGEWVSAFALTEPEAGSSLAQTSTKATRSGNDWLLEGHKTFISNAGIADFYTVLALSGDAQMTMFYVPAHAPGLRVQRFEVLAPHPIGDVYLESVRVPDEYRLGAVGQGMSIALGTLARFRSSVAAAANGFARRAIHESTTRLRTRVQFGKPLASFQALRFDVAEMDTRTRAAELLVEEAARCVDEGSPASAAAVARAKLFATENAGFVCDRAVQHWGGLGVKRGSVVERLYRDVRALRIYEGTSEIQKLVLAKELLG
jgi:acyl-CoA dehydrogenase